jgi:hypothetical protein
VAVNGCVAPTAIVGLAGLILIEVRVAGVTCSEVEPLMEPFFAAIVVAPTPALLARPVALIVAIMAAEEDQVVRGEEVRSWVELSVKVPVAVNCCVSPLAIDGWAGVTVIETKAAGVTVSGTEPEVEPKVAVMVTLPVLPFAGLVASPWLPAASLMVTTVRSEEVQ